jgi:DNA-binding response OmpR family regulator
MLPDIDGFQICKRLRELSNVPILMLTARTKEEDIIHGFGCGADDYVKKPFGVDELVARIQAILNRSYSQTKTNHVYNDGILSIDISAKMVQKRGKQIHLSSTELRLLTSLVSRKGKIVPHDVLLTEVWGSGYQDAKSSLSLYIRYLRRKLEDSPKKPEYIRTEWGTGYWFAPKISNSQG